MSKSLNSCASSYSLKICNYFLSINGDGGMEKGMGIEWESVCLVHVTFWVPPLDPHPPIKSLFFFFSYTGDQTEGQIYVKHVLHHWAVSPASYFHLAPVCLRNNLKQVENFRFNINSSPVFPLLISFYWKTNLPSMHKSQAQSPPLQAYTHTYMDKRVYPKILKSLFV